MLLGFMSASDRIPNANQRSNQVVTQAGGGGGGGCPPGCWVESSCSWFSRYCVCKCPPNGQIVAGWNCGWCIGGW